MGVGDPELKKEYERRREARRGASADRDRARDAMEPLNVIAALDGELRDAQVAEDLAFDRWMRSCRSS